MDNGSVLKEKIMNLKEVKEVLCETQTEILKKLKKEIMTLNDQRLDVLTKDIDRNIKAIESETHDNIQPLKEGLSILESDDGSIYISIEITGKDVKIIGKPVESRSEALEIMREHLSNEPVNNDGVHAELCCAKHGCMYGDKDCPVVLGKIKQNNPCEDCEEEGTE